MPPVNAIRPVRRDDLPALKAIIDATALFPSDALDEMTAAYFEGGANQPDVWLTDDDGGPISVAYYAPERMTLGAWNLYLIAVHPSRQGQGRGATMVRHVELAVAAIGGRMLLIETSGQPAFERTREFYHRCGYEQEARIRDFYDVGADKVIFRKVLDRLHRP